MRTPLGAAAVLVAWTAAGHGQASGDALVHVGIADIRPASVATARVRTVIRESPGTMLLGIPGSFDSPGLALHPAGVQTLAFNASYFFTDQAALELDLGVPPRVEVRGTGIARPPGPSGALFEMDLGDPAINPLGAQRQWSPVLALHYRFRAGRRLRPFAIAGASYTWFTGTRLHPDFARRLDERFGQYLATSSGHPGPTTARARTPPTWGPVCGLGVDWSAGERWHVVLAAGAAPFTVEPELTMRAADGTRLSRTRARVELDAMVTTLAIGYRLFGSR